MRAASARPAPASRRVALGVLALGVPWAVPAAHAQSTGAQVAEADARIESYLERLGLREALGLQLRAHLQRAPADERDPIADRLARLYVDRLESASTPEQRQRVERLARELLDAAPEAETYELRINLEKARYLEAERIAERHRLGLAKPADLEEARRILREARDSFRSIGSSTHRRVERLENLERRDGRDGDRAFIESELEEARRFRSLAMYYAGWSNYYLALLTESSQPAVEAIEHFGWLLNAPGEKTPDIDKVPESLLQYEHVARAAIGVALSHSLRGGEAGSQALQWIEFVRESQQLPEAIRGELPARRLVVYADARRWADIEWMLQQRSDATADDEAPLGVLDARLLAVLTLEARQRGDRSSERDKLLEQLVQTGLAALVRHGEVGHVLDLMETYGTAPIGDEGFIVQYVQGLRVFEDARAEHNAQTDDASKPTDSAELASRYRVAASQLRDALDAGNADAFPAERARCGLQLGLALYYADEPRRAADAFENAWKQARTDEVREQALWFAIVATDRWDRIGDPADEADQRADELAATYIEAFPDNERAARLVLRRADASQVAPAKAAEILLGVPRDSAIHAAARRRAADLLYRAFKSAGSEDRAFAALRFLDVARGVADATRGELQGDEDGPEIARRLLTRYRQMLDAMLKLEPPDAERAAETLDQIERLAEREGVDMDSLTGELNYRRVQIALVTGDEREIDKAVDRLRAVGGQYASAADTLLYHDAYEAWQRSPDSAELAEAVVRHGTRLADRRLADEHAIEDASVRTLLVRIARAGELAWSEGGNDAARDVALRMGRKLIDAGVRTPEVLRRHAALAEGASKLDEALQTWRTLLSGASDGSDLWFRARYNSLRLLAETSPERASQVLRQYRVLNPELGPEPWRDRFERLAQRIEGRAGSGGGT